MWQGYESQMLSRNTIEGVLKFQIRQMDNGVRFYYEITSRQPLSRVLENRNIQAEEIRRLVVGIFGVLERVERYLLREGSILLDPPCGGFVTKFHFCNLHFDRNALLHTIISVFILAINRIFATCLYFLLHSFLQGGGDNIHFLFTNALHLE